MNVVAATRAPAALPASTIAEAGCSVLAMWRVLPGSVMLLAQARLVPAAAGSAHVARPAPARGVFRTMSWTAELAGPAEQAGGGCTFLAAIRLPAGADLDAEALLTLRSDGAGRLQVALPAAAAGAVQFGQLVASHCRQQAAGVARFLLDMLQPRPDQQVPAADAMLRAFLARAAVPDGCIEIMVAVPGCCALLQGWGARLGGPVRVILAGEALSTVAGDAGAFARTDIEAPATGVMLALPAAAGPLLAAAEHVYVLAGDGLHSRAVVRRRLLDPVESVGHVRHMLPILEGPPAMLALLGEALRPRFDGRDTLSGNKHPVRAAVDFVAASPEAGIYLSGWVFDPARVVAALHVKGSAGFSARLDDSWTRVAREDVSTAFRGETGFPRPPDHESGFAVHASAGAGPVPGESLHLQVTFGDGDLAFQPIACADAADAATRARLPAAIDLYKPSGLPIIARHAGPFVAAIVPAADPPAKIHAVTPGRPDLIVVPLAASGPPRALIAGLLHDPLASGEQLVLLCGPDWSAAALDQLRALLAFYGFSATILTVPTTPGPAGALRAAAGLSAGGDLLVIGPSVIGAAAGWRQTLRQTLARHEGAAYACPTLLYEDWSLRFAGTAELRFRDAPPFATLEAGLAGLPAAVAGTGGARPAACGTLACCLVRRAALTALDGAPGLVTDTGAEAAFFQRLHLAGLGGIWVPEVRVYATEEDTATAPQSRVGQFIDGWVLRHIWGPASCAS